MTTQVLPLLDPARGAFWAWASPLAVLVILGGVVLADRLCEAYRDPAGVMAVVDLRTARRALARVDRLALDATVSGAAAYRHLMSVKTWATSDRHYGSPRRQAVVSAVLADALVQLAALGHGPARARIVEPVDGALACPGRYTQVLRRTDAVILYAENDN
jgi:hypothetical protein